MNNTEQISMRIESELKAEFWEICEKRQQTPSKVIKYLMEQYVDNANQTYDEQ